MNEMTSQFEITSIKFNSLSDTMILSGSLCNGNLYGMYELKLCQNMLNEVLNQVQHANPETSVNELLISYEDPYFTDYFFNLETLSNRRISLHSLKKANEKAKYRLIRA